MSHKINPEHLQRLAGVYIRQSSPGQVKNHRESYRVQKGSWRGPNDSDGRPTKSRPSKPIRVSQPANR